MKRQEEERKGTLIIRVASDGYIRGRIAAFLLVAERDSHKVS
jgi:hypothetical protein